MLPERLTDGGENRVALLGKKERNLGRKGRQVVAEIKVAGE